MSNLKNIYGNRYKWYFNRKNKIREIFLDNYHEEPEAYFSSPGRIEILGNHTDHNNGLVMVSSIDLDIIAAVKKRNDSNFYLKSEGYPLNHVDINDLSPKENENGKSNALLRGVLFRMKELDYKIGGMEISTSSKIFKGAGLSSSASFELLIAEIINFYFNDDKIDRVTLAKIAQYSENVYFKKPSGLLDQMGISLGGFNYIDFKDTAHPSFENFNFNLKDYRVVLVNTGGSHASLTKYYASIKEDMKKVANVFHQETLRDVDEKEFYSSLPLIKKKCGGRAILRSIHYFDENKRVKDAYEALKTNDVKTFLEKVNESGESSYSLLENCFVQKDTKQGIALALALSKKYIKDGAVRVHGGGFQGTIIAYVNVKEQLSYIEKMKEVFGERNVLKVTLRPIGTSIINE
ncbi:MAG: galactokinase [Bacillales bacterium]|nr:galactokinase [Bacillales bacterium]